MKTKALISFAVTAKLICVFVFAYAKCWFSHDAALVEPLCLISRKMPMKRKMRKINGRENKFFLQYTSCSFQLLLTFDPILVEKVAYLLNEIMQDNPNVSRLYLTGVFFFIMMYTGSNVLPIAKFLKYTHIKQAFRSDEVRRRVYCDNTPMQYTVILHGCTR